MKSSIRISLKVVALVLALNLCTALGDEPIPTNTKYPGYQGIWFTLGQKSEYGDKYSGGLGTYTAKHVPIAVYSAEAKKTFFVYGGTKNGERHLLNMCSYYDHETGQVPQPTVVLDKNGVNDPHDNASIAIDESGHIWVFVSGRGRKRPGFKFRSAKPYDIDSFEQITEEEITYPQPWWVVGKGFIHLFTKYTDGRELYWNTSSDGYTWTPDQKLAGMGGHYQVANQRDGKIFTAFNMHPGGNVDRRTNLYFVQTDDMGKTWRTAKGETIVTPMVDASCNALIHDYASENRLVYMKDVQFDGNGNPIILVVTSADHAPGPQGDPRIWTVVHWTGDEWAFHEVTRSTHNYDMGSLYIEDGVWRIFAPTERGPQRWGAGGEVAIWVSTDDGKTWAKQRNVTHDSVFNQTYVRRPVNAHPDFYAFWADGNPDVLTPSCLYFTNKSGDQVWKLPYEMSESSAAPVPVSK